MELQTLVTSAILFFLCLSLSLTVLFVKQRKQTKLLKSLSSPDKVMAIDSYSNFGVARRGDELVVKCPACAEWIKIEANICKFCQREVSDLTRELREEVARLDNQRHKLQTEITKMRKERNKRLVQDWRFRSVSIVIVFSITLLIVQSVASDRSRKETIEAIAGGDRAAIARWESQLRDCGISLYKIHQDSSNDFNLVLYLDSPLKNYDWSKTVGREINCFSKRALGFKLSDKLDWDGDLGQWVGVSEKLQIWLGGNLASAELSINFDKFD